MKSEDEQMIQRIMDTDTMGYASVYDSGSGKREEYLVALTAENLASLIGRKGGETRQITVTDVLDRLVADSRKGTLDNCPDQRLCRKEAYRDPGLRLEERACVFGEKVREFSHAVEEGCGQEVPSAQLAQRMWPQQSLSSVLTSTVQDTENRLARMDFKIAVELSMLAHMIAYHSESRIDESVFRKLHAKCVEEVRRLNGAVELNDAYKYRKREN